MKRLLTYVCSLVFLLTAWVWDTRSAANLDQAVITKGNNAFAVELYGQLRNQPGNLFFSPESISTALAMTYAGARGDTATEMANVLHLTLPPEKLHPAMGALVRDLNAAHDGYQLKVANALWGQQGYYFLDDFVKLTKVDYGVGLKQLDFTGATEAARQTINTRVEQQTENKIKDLIAQGVLTKDTRLVLTNAIYFKGDWEKPFKKEYTRQWDFHASATQTVTVPQMQSADEFNYFNGETFQVLEIPYRNKELSMIAFLPNDPNGLATFEQSLTSESMQQWLGQLKPAPEVLLVIPKFTMEKQFRLEDTLAVMGMKQAFSGKLADFGGMASQESMQRNGNLCINAVIHKAYLGVNEEGTEAAATTAAAMIAMGIPTVLPPPPPIVFRADHPFLFVIRDNTTGAILFMGRVADPTN